MRLTLLFLLLTLSAPAWADDYVLNVSTGAVQEDALQRAVRKECRDRVAQGQGPIAGLNPDCTGTPTAVGKQNYLEAVALNHLNSVVAIIRQRKADETRKKYVTGTNQERQAIDQASGVPEPEL